jgi:hypothetical protein
MLAKGTAVRFPPLFLGKKGKLGAKDPRAPYRDGYSRINASTS